MQTMQEIDFTNNSHISSTHVSGTTTDVIHFQSLPLIKYFHSQKKCKLKFKDEDFNIDEYSVNSDCTSSVDDNDNKPVLSDVEKCSRFENVTIMRVS